MHRIDAPGFAPGNLFTDGNPSTGTPATVVDAGWLNDVQENLVRFIEALGITPVSGNYNQLIDGILTYACQRNVASVAAAGGTANALTASFTPVVTSLTAGMIFRVRAGAANTTTTPTFTPNSGSIAAKIIVKGAGAPLAAGDIAGAGHWIELQYDLTLDRWVMLNPATGVSITPSLPLAPARQTALGGPVDSNGLPSFLPGSSGSLSLVSQNIAAGSPLVVAAANGFNSTGAIDRIGLAASNLTWSALVANTTNYLFVDIAANGALTTGSTTLAPIYQQGGSPVVTANQATFNIAQMQMFVGNGSSAAQAFRVFVGEAVTGASSVTSAVAYAYMGRFQSSITAIGVGTLYTFAHNLGYATPHCEVLVRQNSTYDWETVGSYNSSDASIFRGLRFGASGRNIGKVQTQANAISPAASPVSPFSSAAATSGELIFIANRGW